MPSRRIIHGIATSPGLAQGGVHVVRANMGEVPTWTVSGDEIEREVERLQRALVAAGEEMARRQRVVAAQSGENDAQIFAVHALILKDPAALKEVVGNVRTQRINAEAAVLV